MSLVFFYAPMSTASLTEAVLAELAVPCERVRVDLKNKPPELLAANPNARVPTIVHDGVAIWESCAITMYLGEVFGVDAGLYPAPGPRRGEAMTWIAWSNVTLAEAGMRLFMAGHHGDASAGEKARGDLAGLLGILDGALAGRSYLLGDYTLADTHLHGILSWFGMIGVDVSTMHNITGWLARVSARPAVAKLMASWRGGLAA